MSLFANGEKLACRLVELLRICGGSKTYEFVLQAFDDVSEADLALALMRLLTSGRASLDARCVKLVVDASGPSASLQTDARMLLRDTETLAREEDLAAPSGPEAQSKPADVPESPLELEPMRASEPEEESDQEPEQEPVLAPRRETGRVSNSDSSSEPEPLPKDAFRIEGKMHRKADSGLEGIPESDSALKTGSERFAQEESAAWIEPEATTEPEAGPGIGLDESAQMEFGSIPVPYSASPAEAGEIPPTQGGGAPLAAQSPSPLDMLRNISVAELDMFPASFRRKLKNAGCASIYEALSLTDDEVDRILDFGEADQFDHLRQEVEANPGEFVGRILGVSVIDDNEAQGLAPMASAIPSCNSDDSKAESKPDDGGEEAPPPAVFASGGRARTQHPPTPTRKVYVSSLLPFVKPLDGFEKRAARALDEVDDRGEGGLVFEAFPAFVGEVDELSAQFGELFAHYAGNPGRALDVVEGCYADSFLLFVADRARKLFDGENLWGKLFADIGIAAQSAQVRFKQLFIAGLERRGMPVYGRGDETFYYLYTALLHGGLSGDSWEALWEGAFIPAAKAAGATMGGVPMDGLSVLVELKRADGCFRLRKSAMSIVEKVPESALVPLFDEALQVAREAASRELSDNDVALISEAGLSETAMDALVKVLDEAAARRGAPRATGVAAPAPKREYAHFARGELVLDLARGEAVVRWGKQLFPAGFLGRRVDYLVDGEVRQSVYFEPSAGKAILREVEIPVSPKSRYEVELRLMLPSSGEGEYEPGASIRQEFRRSRPGCFEFIRSATTGLYRLRGERERITRRRRVAYVVQAGYYIDPGPGMETVEEYQAVGSWQDMSVFVFDVDPGAFGSICREGGGDSLAIWREDYSVHVCREGVVGETADGRDLFGFAPNALGTNGALPTLVVEVQDADSAWRDLEVECLCDGVRVSVPRHMLWQDVMGDTDCARIEFDLAKAAGVPLHAADCVVTVSQASTGRAIFRYRFAVVPIQAFHLDSVSRVLGRWTACYSLQAREDIRVVDSGGYAAVIPQWGTHLAHTLLGDEFYPLSISDARGLAIDVKLALAAVDIMIPDTLDDIVHERPLCLVDALDMGAHNANIVISSKGRRNRRKAYVSLGHMPLLFEDLARPETFTCNLFRRVERFAQEDFSAPADLPLVLTLAYGSQEEGGAVRPASVEIPLLSCREGLGFASVELSPDGKSVELDAPTVADTAVFFVRRIGGRDIAQLSIPAGETSARLPNAVTRLLSLGKKVDVEFCPVGIFGDPDRSHSFKLVLC